MELITATELRLFLFERALRKFGCRPPEWRVLVVEPPAGVGDGGCREVVLRVGSSLSTGVATVFSLGVLITGMEVAGMHEEEVAGWF